jgi:sigma-B regulation protein RsbU (phosphoserine phosphatase)
VPRALYSAFAAELVRSRTVRRRYTPDKFSVAGVLQSMNTILHDRQLEEYYCTLCYAFFDFKRRVVTISNSGLPYPGALHGERVRPDRAAGRAARLVLGRDLRRGDDSAARRRRLHLCTDGIFEAAGPDGKEFGAKRVCDVVQQNWKGTARETVDAIFDAVIMFRGTAPQADDMTAVAVKITA